MNKTQTHGVRSFVGQPWLIVGLMLALLCGCAGSPPGSAPGSSKSASPKAPETPAKSEPHPDPR